MQITGRAKIIQRYLNQKNKSKQQKYNIQVKHKTLIVWLSHSCFMTISSTSESQLDENLNCVQSLSLIFVNQSTDIRTCFPLLPLTLDLCSDHVKALSALVLKTAHKAHIFQQHGTPPGAAIFLLLLQKSSNKKWRGDKELMKEATFISFSAAPRVQRALSSPKHRDQSTNLIWWMNTSQGGVIRGSKSHLERHPTLTEEYYSVSKGFCIHIMIRSICFSTKKS